MSYGRVVEPARVALAFPVCRTGVLLLDDGPVVPRVGFEPTSPVLQTGAITRLANGAYYTAGASRSPVYVPRSLTQPAPPTRIELAHSALTGQRSRQGTSEAWGNRRGSNPPCEVHSLACCLYTTVTVVRDERIELPSPGNRPGALPLC